MSKKNNKCMTNIHGKRIIDTSLDNAATYTNEIIIVVGYYGEQIRNYVGKKWKGASVKYVIQEKQKGLLNAIKCAQNSIEGEDFLLFLGDEIIVKSHHDWMIDAFYSNNAFAVCGLSFELNSERIKKTYCVHMCNGLINKLEEKPLRPKTNWMGTGNCIFNNRFFDYMQVGDEDCDKSFPDILQIAINRGEKVYGTVFCEKYYNINTREDYLEYMEEAL